VEELLAAGISVVTSINLHYIKELQDEVASITGKKAPQSVPRKFLEQADGIVVVDAPAHDEKLAALREMALLFAADVIDSRLEDYLHGHGFEETWGIQERVLVCITPRSNAAAMIDAGKRNTDRFKGELYALYVRQAGLSPEDQAALDSNIAIAIERGAEVNVIDSDDAIGGILEFARKHSTTQIVVGHSIRQRWLGQFKNTNVERLLESADGIDVWIFPQ
jgi:two-component system sensor histidine kinase KdpD